MDICSNFCVIACCITDRRDRDVSDAMNEGESDAMRLPEISDMLVMYATVSGRLSKFAQD